MSRDGVLTQLVVLVAFSEVSEVDMFEGSNRKADMLS